MARDDDDDSTTTLMMTDDMVVMWHSPQAGHCQWPSSMNSTNTDVKRKTAAMTPWFMALPTMATPAERFRHEVAESSVSSKPGQKLQIRRGTWLRGVANSGRTAKPW
eukprot:8068422-Lingulodinium_polyedra.AAC.1